MTVYQETLTEPFYFGQGVLFTVSHIENVGINLEDDESAKSQVSAAVILSLVLWYRIGVLYFLCLIS